MREFLAGVPERVLVTAHTHVSYERTVDGVRLVNPGSVGMPYEGAPGAYWALLGPDVEHRRTETTSSGRRSSIARPATRGPI